MNLIKLYTHKFALLALLSSFTIIGSDAEELATAINLQPLSAAINVSRQFKEPAFQIPEGLRPRVNFWKDVFTRYGEQHAIIHHRLYPQAVFEVVDFSEASARMGGREFERYKDKLIETKLQDYKDAITRMLENGRISSAFDQNILDSLKFVPGDNISKLRRILDEDLIRTQTGIKERYADAIRRSGRYLPMMESIFVREFGLPKELTRLPFVESSFDYQAYSAVGAAGIWQFMPNTARHYMMVNKVIDERRDPLASTRAAAQYLIGARQRLGSWALALTSYNHGIAGVLKKVNQVGTADIVELIENPDKQVFGFASANFYPEFLAALEIFEQHPKYFPSVALEPALTLREISVSKAISLDFAARQVGVSRDSLASTNYAFSRTILEGRAKIPAGYKLRVASKGQGATSYSSLRAPEPKPYKAPQVLKRSPNVSKKAVPAPTSKFHTVQAGETLYSIAREKGTTVKTLQKLNGLKNARVLVGKKLKLP